MATNIDIEPRRHGLHLPPKVILPVAAVLAGLGALYIASSRGGEPTTSKLPVPQTTGQDEPPKSPEIPVVAPPPPDTAPAPTKAEPPPALELKPLPDVINSQTVKFVSLPDSEILTLLNQQKEPKIPLPDIPSGLSIKEIKSKTGHSMLAIYGQATNLDLPVLLAGKIIQILVGRSATYDGIVIKTEDGKLWGYVVPSPAKSRLKEHDLVSLNQVAISINYVPGNLDTEDFKRYVQKQYIDAPPNTVAVITGLNPNGINKTDILRTGEGNVATTGATLK